MNTTFRKAWWRTGLIGVLLSTGAGAQTASEQVDASFLQRQSEQLYSTIEQAVSAAGGDLNRQHVHLVFAFSTGHFAKDPLMAEAARAVASDVAAGHLVNGDQLSGYAWEMNVWPHKGDTLNPLTVGPDRAAMRASFQDLWPRSPQAGSNGGHDTEAAIAALTGQLSSDRAAVLVLLTNSAASQAGTAAQRTIGENSPTYLSALENWTRLRTSSTTGATVQLAIAPDRPERLFDAVIVVPKQFTGAALDGERSALVAAQVQAADAPTSSSLPWWVWVLGGVAVAAGAVLAIRARNNRPAASAMAGDERIAAAPSASRSPKGAQKLALHVGGRRFALDAAKPGDTVCVLCGSGYPVGTSPGQYVVLSQSDLPPIRLLTVTRERQGLKLSPETDVSLAGELPTTLPLKDAEYRLKLSGRAARQNLPPRPYQADVVLSLKPLDETEN